MKFLCDNCKAKYQIADEKVAGKTVRMKCRRCGHNIQVTASAGLADGRSTPAPPSGEAEALDGSHALSVLPQPPHAAPHAAEAAPAAPAPRVPTPIRPAPVVPLRPSPPTRATPVPPARPVPVRQVPATAGGSPRPPDAAATASLQDAAKGFEEDESTSIMELPPREADGGPAAARAAFAPRPAAGRPSPAATPRAAAVVTHVAPVARLERPAPMAPAAPHARHGGGVAAAFSRAVVAHPDPRAEPPDSAPEPELQRPGEWFVGVGGTPLGPVRLDVIREKALSGAVTGESLVWREGFEEWIVLRNVPELAHVVMAAQTARLASSVSRAPPAPPADTAAAARRAQALRGPSTAAPENEAAGTAALDAPAPRGPEAPAARSIQAPLGPAARSSQVPQGSAAPAAAVAPDVAVSTAKVEPHAALVDASASRAPTGGLDVLKDPFADLGPAPGSPGGVATGALSPAASRDAAPRDAAGPASAEERPRERPRAGMPPVAYAFIAMAAMFGGVAAYVLLTRPPPPPQIVVIKSQEPAMPAASTPAPALPPPGATEQAVAPPASASASAEPSAVARLGGPMPARSGEPKAQPSSTATAAIDRSGFNIGVAGPTAVAPGGPDPTLATSQLSPGEISGIVSRNTPIVKRKCWQPALEARQTNGASNARVSANITIGPSGNVEQASASGGEKDFPGLSSCIAGLIKGWKFPASGGSSPVAVPFVFASQ